MSMIGMFGVCSQSHYNKLANLLKSKDSGETEKLMQEIYSEVEASAEKLANDQCSGEVFTALFYYLKTAYGIDLRRGKEAFREKWTAVSGDWDAVVFHEKEQLLSQEDSMDFGGLQQFINDFYQTDYGDSGQTAWNVLLGNLKRTGPEQVLIWHMF